MNISRKKVVISAASSLVALILIGIYYFMEGKTTGITALKMLPREIGLQVKDVIYKEIGTTGATWEIKAANAQYLHQENLALFERIEIKFIMSGGRFIIVSGDRGELNTLSQDMVIGGNVSVISDDGNRFRTNKLHFSKQKELVFTDKPITMENEHMRIDAVGMSLCLKEEKLSLQSRVKAQVY